MNEIIGYVPKVQHTDLTLLLHQNLTVFGEQFVDWKPYILLQLPKRWGKN